MQPTDTRTRPFAVSPVQPARQLLPTTTLLYAFEPVEDWLAAEPILCHRTGAAERVAEEPASNSLVSAVYLAHAQHRPLCLSPDAIWLTIAQGVAHHIRQDSESLRQRLVDHSGHRTIQVAIAGPSDDRWLAATDAIASGLASEAGWIHDLLACDFSTTGPLERMASSIVLMDAVQDYFAFEIEFICGVPSIRLRGTVEDWREIERRVGRLPGIGLGEWAARLAPITGQFVRAAGGDVDVPFWQDICRAGTAIGYDCGEEIDRPGVDGWITALFPTTGQSGVAALDGFPRGVNSAPFLLDDGTERREMKFKAGLVGVGQDPATLELEPEMGWAIVEAAGGE